MICCIKTEVRASFGHVRQVFIILCLGIPISSLVIRENTAFLLTSQNCYKNYGYNVSESIWKMENDHRYGKWDSLGHKDNAYFVYFSWKAFVFVLGASRKHFDLEPWYHLLLIFPWLGVTYMPAVFMHCVNALWKG